MAELIHTQNLKNRTFSYLLPAHSPPDPYQLPTWPLRIDWEMIEYGEGAGKRVLEKQIIKNEPNYQIMFYEKR